MTQSLSAVMDIIKGQSSSENSNLKPFPRGGWNCLSSECLLRGRRVIIKLSVRTLVLQQLYSGHSRIYLNIFLVAMHGLAN